MLAQSALSTQTSLSNEAWIDANFYNLDNLQASFEKAEWKFIEHSQVTNCYAYCWQNSLFWQYPEKPWGLGKLAMVMDQHGL